MRFNSLRSIRTFALAASVLLLAASQLRAQSTAAAAPQRPKITGISHVGYFVSDLPKAIAFWHEEGQ
jgi:lactoylglutathione lyase